MNKDIKTEMEMNADPTTPKTTASIAELNRTLSNPSSAIYSLSRVYPLTSLHHILEIDLSGWSLQNLHGIGTVAPNLQKVNL